MPPRLQKQRARTVDDKELRRASLLAAARHGLLHTDWTELRIEDVARHAGIAKASVFRYFDSKEELVLAVYLIELRSVFTALGIALGDEPLDVARAAHRVATTLCEHPLFVRLSTAMHAALARRVSVELARRFKLALLAQLDAAGALLEERLAPLPRGTGVRLLVRLHAAMIGLAQLANPPPSVAEAIAAGGLEPFRIDFAHEIAAIFVGLLKTMEEPS